MQLNYMRKRVGFTLIEMMIALVITMMMVFAMVEAFQWIGEATTTGRAQIEMAGQLRAARYRLELDLNGVTVPMHPWGAKNADHGYFELIEGTASDSNPSQFVNPSPFVPPATNGYTAIDFNDPAIVIASTNDGDPLALASKSMFGDLDDILMFTARNDLEPFRGRYVTKEPNSAPQTIIIESNLAEIIWWAELNDTKPDGAPDGQWSPGETFTIRRRVLLIRPDLVDASTGNTNLNLYTTNTTDPNYPNIAIDNLTIAKFLDENDISIRPVYDSNFVVTAYAPNTLADLSLRHNRVAHWGISNLRDSGTTPQLTGLSNTAVGHLLSPVQIDQNYFPSFRSASNHFGEDVILTNVTAFDFRVWDANIPIVKDAGLLNEALGPGDPGYAAQITAASASVAAANQILAGQGAYVDLGALANDSNTLIALTGPLGSTPPPLINPATGQPFQYGPALVGFPNYKSFLYPFTINMGTVNMPYNTNYPFVYDPWTMAYEKDGFNQDEDLDATGNSLVDEGTDGLDTLDQNTGAMQSGPDDAKERETSPPYPSPLKSIRVSIRMYEPDTRQIRQSTHEMSFSE